MQRREAKPTDQNPNNQLNSSKWTWTSWFWFCYTRSHWLLSFVHSISQKREQILLFSAGLVSGRQRLRAVWFRSFKLVVILRLKNDFFPASAAVYFFDGNYVTGLNFGRAQMQQPWEFYVGRSVELLNVNCSMLITIKCGKVSADWFISEFLIPGFGLLKCAVTSLINSICYFQRDGVSAWFAHNRWAQLDQNFSHISAETLLHLNEKRFNWLPS